MAIPPTRGSGPLRPTRLGQWEVIAKIAGGGMSAVYLGRRVESGEVVALKIARHDMRMDERMLQMFLEEGKLIARLDHPNIVRTLEVGGDAEQDFIAMELMLGKTFAAIHDATVSRSVRLGPDIAAWTAARVADALHYAHELTDEAGRPLALVHRDVNPANVFATFAGEVKLFDFGLAKVTAGDASGSHLIAGKLSYLSPEQIMQMPLDRRSDVFSLGTTLWELLTGRRLFRRDSDVDTVRAVQLGPIPDPRNVAPEIPEDLARIVRRALERNREHRYARASQLAEELDAFVLARTSRREVATRLAQLVDHLFPGEQKRQSGWLKPAIHASMHPSPGPAGPISRAALPRVQTTGRPPARSMSPDGMTAVMAHPPRHDSSARGLPSSSASLPSSRPSVPRSTPSGHAPPVPSSEPTASAAPDTVRHTLNLRPRESVPFLDADEVLESSDIATATPFDGVATVETPATSRSPAAMAPHSVTRPSWPAPANRAAPSPPPPPKRYRASAPSRPPSREPSIPPPPASSTATEISMYAPAPPSRTQIDATPAHRVGGANPSSPSLAPKGAPGAAVGPSRRPPVPLPSRSKANDAKPSKAPSASPPRHPSVPPHAGKAPESDTRIDMPPPGKRS